jgi:exodeoxyribonuclease VII small subunit
MTDQPETSLFGTAAVAEPASAAAPSPEGAAAAPATSTPPAADRPDVSALAFDRALADLQTVVQRLETGGLPLEESIALYERGVALHEHCAKLLTDAELRVQRLVEQAGGALRTLDFDPDDASD